MRPEVLQLLHCPRCGGALQSPEPVPDRLACTVCAASYPLLDGMPRLLSEDLPRDRTAQSFELQWSLHSRGVFEKDTLYGETAAQELQSFLDRFGVQAPGALAGRRILDIGCGSGRLTQGLALFAPDALVVGGDRTAVAHLAHQRCRGLPNALVAQFDLHTPPFPAASFDLIYADGVLPHVPEPRAALQNLDRLLRPGGQLFVWMYPRRFSPYRLTRDLLVRPYRFPHALQQALCWGIGVPLHAAFKIYESFQVPRRRSLREVVFMLHDNLTPEFQHRRTPEELAAEFERLGYAGVRCLQPPAGVVGTKRGSGVPVGLARPPAL